MNMAKKQKRIFTTGNPDSRGTHNAHDYHDKKTMEGLSEQISEEEYKELLERNEPREREHKRSYLEREVENKKEELKRLEKDEKEMLAQLQNEDVNNPNKNKPVKVMYDHRRIKGPPPLQANTGRVFEKIIKSGDKGVSEDEILGLDLIPEDEKYLPKYQQREIAKKIAKEKGVPIIPFVQNFHREFGISRTGSIERKGVLIKNPTTGNYVVNKEHKTYHDFVSLKKRHSGAEEQRKRERGD
jgi:hypothetical protein